MTQTPALPAVIAAERLRAQMLVGRPGRTPTEVVGHLLAVQAQDPRGARLAVRARSTGPHASDIDRALTADRSLVITTLNRGTLHLVRTEDYWWLHALTTPPIFVANARRLAQEGVTPSAADRGVEVIERSLTLAGPLTRARLREKIAAAGVRVEGQALAHILLLAALRGVTVRGPMVAGEHAYAAVREWLGESPLSPKPDRDRILIELARRYLAGHGPASARDLARWAGLPLRDARLGLAGIGPSLEDRAGGLVSLGRAGEPAGWPSPRLLGAFDPALLGWESREFVLGAHQGVVTINGIFRPFALVAGRAAGTWSLPHGEVVLAPFAPLAPEVRRALDEDAHDVRRFLAREGE